MSVLTYLLKQLISRSLITRLLNRHFHSESRKDLVNTGQSKVFFIAVAMLSHIQPVNSKRENKGQ